MRFAAPRSGFLPLRFHSIGEVAVPDENLFYRLLRSLPAACLFPALRGSFCPIFCFFFSLLVELPSRLIFKSVILSFEDCRSLKILEKPVTESPSISLPSFGRRPYLALRGGRGVGRHILPRFSLWLGAHICAFLQLWIPIPRGVSEVSGRYPCYPPFLHCEHFFGIGNMSHRLILKYGLQYV